MKFPRILALAVSLLLLIPLAAACGDDDATPAPGSSSTATAPKQVTLRLGYFPNITHAQPLIGVADGTFARELGPNVKLAVKTFNAGPAAIEAMFAGEIDAAYIGPNPAINGFVKSNGEALRIVAGAASGGASLVVRADRNINAPADFKGKKIASPQLGNTQDVALRAWLMANGHETKEHGGDVTVLPTASADTLTLFKKGDIDGAWVPEPWATRLVLEAGGKVFLGEQSLWPGGQFVTTHLIVSTDYLKDHAGVVESLVRANVKVTEWINANPEEAKALVNSEIGRLTSAPLSKETIDGAWQNIVFTYDPIASSLKKSAEDAFALGFLGDKKPDLSKIYDLTLLTKVLAQLNLPAIKE